MAVLAGGKANSVAAATDSVATALHDSAIVAMFDVAIDPSAHLIRRAIDAIINAENNR